MSNWKTRCQRATEVCGCLRNSREKQPLNTSAAKAFCVVRAVLFFCFWIFWEFWVWGCTVFERSSFTCVYLGFSSAFMENKCCRCNLLSLPKLSTSQSEFARISRYYRGVTGVAFLMSFKWYRKWYPRASFFSGELLFSWAPGYGMKWVIKPTWGIR